MKHLVQTTFFVQLWRFLLARTPYSAEKEKFFFRNPSLSVDVIVCEVYVIVIYAFTKTLKWITVERKQELYVEIMETKYSGLLGQCIFIAKMHHSSGKERVKMYALRHIANQWGMIEFVSRHETWIFMVSGRPFCAKHRNQCNYLLDFIKYSVNCCFGLIKL